MGTREHGNAICSPVPPCLALSLFVKSEGERRKQAGKPADGREQGNAIRSPSPPCHSRALSPSLSVVLL